MEPMENKLAKVNPGWDKDLIIRYVIVELAPYFRRDLYYFLSSPSKQVELFNGGYTPQLPNIFCKTLCEQYQIIFSRFGINSKVIQASDTTGRNAVPLFAIIVEGDNGWFYLNPLKDLWSHQLRLASNEFGIIGYNNEAFVMEQYPFLQTLDKEYIAEIDQELGFVSNSALIHPDIIGGKDLNHYRKRKGLDPKAPYWQTAIAKIQDIGEKFLNIGAVKGPIERNLMYKYFFTLVFTKPEKGLVKVGFNREQDYAITLKVNDGNDIITFQEELDENDRYSLVRK